MENNLTPLEEILGKIGKAEKLSPEDIAKLIMAGLNPDQSGRILESLGRSRGDPLVTQDTIAGDVSKNEELDK